MRSITFEAKKRYEGARSIVRDYLRLKKGEKFLIIYDETTEGMVPYIEEEATKAGVKTSTFLYNQNSQQKVTDKDSFPSQLLTKIVDKHSILNCLSDKPQCTVFRKLVLQLGQKVGTRIAHMPGLSVQHLAKAFRADFTQMARWNEILFRKLYFAQTCKLITRSKNRIKPFTLYLDLGGTKRPPAQSGIPRDGSWCNIPGAEVYIAPIEDTANGDIVINGSMLNHVFREKDEVIISFDKGAITDWKANSLEFQSKLKAFRASHEKDPNWNKLCELGIGLNNRFRKPSGIQILDEKIRGTAHIAIGDNTQFDGRISSKVHQDFVTIHPDIHIEGKLVMKAGKFVIKRSDAYENLKTIVANNVRFRDTNFHLTSIPTIFQNHKLAVKLSDARFQDFLLQVGDDKTATRVSEFMSHLRDIAGPRGRIQTEDIDHKFTQVPEMLTLLLKYELIAEVKDGG